MTRRRLTEREVIAVLIQQGAVIPCYRCRLQIEDAQNTEREHLHELELGGPDTLDNMRFSHKVPCHHEITNGNGATSAGSSKNRIGKAKRGERERLFGKKPTKNPIRSRGFDKRLTKHFDGRVEKRT